MRPVPWGAEDLAARHAVVTLVNQHPQQLWPILNALTLTSTTDVLPNTVNWCAVLAHIRMTLQPNRRPKDCRT